MLNLAGLFFSFSGIVSSATEVSDLLFLLFLAGFATSMIFSLRRPAGKAYSNAPKE
jgi:uncharacterized membrane protein YtjA (UPF0391 family)